MLSEYHEGEPFPGRIEVTSAESDPAWPAPTRAPAGAPNVIVVVLDDVGYAQLGCYGSDIETPTFDRLARGGLRYTRFHTTALCSPTRAALLTGRNHHSVGMGTVPEIAMGFPGYHTRIPKSAGMLPEILREHGYATFAVGKWHLTPAEERHAGARTRERWPLGRGFDRYYGFLDGQTDQWSPELVEDNRLLDPRSISLADFDEHEYHLTEDLADHAIAMIRDLESAAPARPFLLYFAPGACHAPHQVPSEWADRYRGRFDAGWDAWRATRFAKQKELGLVPADTELPPWDPTVRHWDELPAEERRLARMMEVFAGFLTHTDHQVGRVLDVVERLGRLDDTIVVVLSDNGASAEGGPHGTVNESLLFNGIGEDLAQNLSVLDAYGGPTTRGNYPTGWTTAGCTPFRRWKTEVYRGGVTDPLIVHWPNGIDARGELRHQWCHVNDITPTLLECIGIEPPATLGGVPQMPMEGVSLADSLADADTPTRKEVQYFENFGQRAIWAGGWKAIHRHHPLVVGSGERLAALPWELYDVERDPTECHDVAAEHPELVAALEERWWAEAERYHVLPLRSHIDLGAERPRVAPATDHFVYWPGSMIPETEVANVKNRSHVVTAYARLDPGDAGALVAQGTRFGGWTLFVQDGRLCSVHNYVGREEFALVGDTPVPTGRPVALTLEFTRTGEHCGEARLLVDGEEVARGEIPRTVPTRFGVGSGSLRVGDDAGISVTARYEAPFEFTGSLDRVTIDLLGPDRHDPARDLDYVMPSQ